MKGGNNVKVHKIRKKDITLVRGHLVCYCEAYIFSGAVRAMMPAYALSFFPGWRSLLLPNLDPVAPVLHVIRTLFMSCH